MHHDRMTRLLISCGWIGPVLFTLVYTIDGATRPGYEPLQHWISHLSLGPRGWLNMLNLLVFGCLMLGFFAAPFAREEAPNGGLGCPVSSASLPSPRGCSSLTRISDILPVPRRS